MFTAQMTKEEEEKFHKEFIKLKEEVGDWADGKNLGLVISVLSDFLAETLFENGIDLKEATQIVAGSVTARYAIEMNLGDEPIH